MLYTTVCKVSLRGHLAGRARRHLRIHGWEDFRAPECVPCVLPDSVGCVPDLAALSTGTTRAYVGSDWLPLRWVGCVNWLVVVNASLKAGRLIKV